jgi:formiminotetrahydrofolate cyclodeaminase
MSLIDLSARNLLDAFSSGDPTPGGGSAAALSSAIGASLLMMVAGLPKTRSGSEEDRAALTAASAALAEIRAGLSDAIDADSDAYDRVVAAYKMPKASAEEQSARKAAIQQALRAATDVPLGVMTLSVRAVEQANTVARHGYQSARSDIGVAIGLLTAGTAGARLNVDVNLETVSDAAYRDATAEEARRLMTAAGDDARAAEALLR